MYALELLIALIGTPRHRPLYGVAEPTREVRGERYPLCIEGEPTFALGEGLPQLRGNFSLRTSVYTLAPGTRRGVDHILGLPAAVFALLVGSLAVGSLTLCHAQSSLRFFSRPANASTLSGSYNHPAAVLTARSFRASAR